VTITIHHIHGDGFPEVKGSISVDHLLRAIKSDHFLTFDDSLKCQELALPLLKKYKKKACFFVNCVNNVERQREFVQDPNFYEWFFSSVQRVPAPDWFLIEYDFYSQDDKDYRWFRDYVDPKGHDRIVGFKDIESLDCSLLGKYGQEIGLHTATHPRRLNALDMNEEWREWEDNLIYATQYGKVTKASYPMGRKSKRSGIILYMLGIKEAFSSSEHTTGRYNQPRTDIWKSGL